MNTLKKDRGRGLASPAPHDYSTTDSVAQTVDSVKGGGTYTALHHAPLDSPAGRCCDPIAIALYVEFQRRWQAEVWRAKKQERQPRPVSFTWVGFPWPISRNTFDKHRNTLAEHGFIKPVLPKKDTGKKSTGLYLPSDEWQTYTPMEREAKALSAHEASRRAQAHKTIEHRKGSAQKPSTAPESEANPNAQILSTAPNACDAQNLSNPQCAKTEQPPVRKNRAHKITDYLITTPLPPNPADDDGVGVGVSSVLASLGTAIEANEHDPEHQRRVDAFQRSLQESTTAQRAEQAKRQAELAQRQSPEAISAMVGISIEEAQEWIGRLGASLCYSVAEGVANDKRVTSPRGAFRHRARIAANKCTRKVGAAC